MTQFKEQKEITKKEIHEITSFVSSTYFDNIWDNLLSINMNELRIETMKIINTGYPINYLLLCVKDKIVEEKKFDDKKIAILLSYLGKIERMIISGSDTFIQFLGLLTYINALSKNIIVEEPNIF